MNRLAPRFLDSVQLGSQRQQVDGPGAPLVNSGRPFYGGQNVGLASEQASAFRLWQYIAVNRLSNTFAQTWPIIGKLEGVTGPGGGQMHLRGVRTANLNRSQMAHLRQHYGGIHRQIVQQNMDVQPVADSHPAYEVLRNVNPVDTWYDFAYELTMFVRLTGILYVWSIPNGFGRSTQLWVVPPQWVEERHSRAGQLVEYRITPEQGTTFSVPPEEIIKRTYKSPVSKSDAWSPLRAGAEWVDNAENIERSRWHAFRNGLNPSYVYELDPERYTADPTAEVIERIRKRMRSVGTYGVEGTGGDHILPPGVKPHESSRAPKEMDYSGSSVENRDANLALQGTPAIVAGIADNTLNRATADAANEVYCEVTVNPHAAWVAAGFTEFWLPQFGPGLVMFFEDAKPINREQELEESKFDWQVGALSPDERAVERGRDPQGTEASQARYVQGTMVPLTDDLLEPPEPPPVPGADGGGDDEPNDEPEPDDDK